MSSPVGHALVGVGLAVVVGQSADTSLSASLLLGAAVASNLPDLDWIGVVLGAPRRIHRGPTHSLVLLGGVIGVAWLVLRLLPGEANAWLGLAWAMALLSHPVVDVLTTSPDAAARGFGIPLLWPLSGRRWALRRPLFRSAEPTAFLSLRGTWQAVSHEIVVLGPVFAVLVLLGRLIDLAGIRLLL